MLRMEDANQMRLLGKELRKLRKEEKMPLKKASTIKQQSSNRPQSNSIRRMASKKIRK